MVIYQGSCDVNHRWREWVWARAQYPAQGCPLESVWVRLCENCGSREVRRTRPNQRPDSDCQVRGAILGQPPVN